MKWRPLIERLTAADTFARVGIVVCEESAARFGVHQSIVCRFAADRRPAVMVDDVPDGTAEARLRYLASFPIDPLLAVMFEHHCPVAAGLVEPNPFHAGPAGRPAYTELVPLIEPAGLLGFVRVACAAPPTPALRRDLAVMATYVSARLARLGVTAVDGPLAALTRRQHEVARLAGLGLTNSEIAADLGISVNTVKKQLKEAFARLDVCCRAELATLAARAAPEDDLPVGVSQMGPVWVTVAR